MSFWFSESHTDNVKLNIMVDAQLYSKTSNYQKIDIFQMSAATTYEHAVGRKKTDRKNVCATVVRATSVSSNPATETS